MPSSLRGCALLLAMAAAGCSFRSGLPSSSHIACGAGSACPEGYQCRPTIGLCITNAEARAGAAAVVNPELTPTIGGADTTFTLDFQVSAPLAQTPVAVATSVAGASDETFPFTCDPCSASLACHCAWTLDSAHLPEQGSLPVSVAIVDAAGNAPAPTGVGAIDFDTTPPALTGPPVVTLSAPAGVTTPVGALGNGASAQICFDVDEALSATPEVWAGAAGPDAGLVFSLVAGYPQRLSYCFTATLTSSVTLPDGALSAWAFATDLAGNSATLPLSAAADGGALLSVIRTPPAPPDLSETTGLRYHRAPWGEVPTIGVPHLAVTSSGPALGEAGTLIAYADSAESVELGRGFVAAAASVQVTLAPADQPEIWVDVADLAGNRLAGGAVRVRSVDWVLTLGLKQAGDETSNPHDCYARARQGPSLIQGDDPSTSLSAATGPTGRDGGSTPVTGAVSWRMRATGLPDQTELAYAYDPAHGDLTELEADGVTHVFDGLDWSSPPWPLQPTARLGTAMSFDRRRGRVVLFGGEDQTVFGSDLCDTWELGPSGWTLFPCGRAIDGGSEPAGLPAPRQGACIGFDSARAWTVLIGGIAQSGAPLNDVSAWDGTTWTALPPPAPELSCLRNNLLFDERLGPDGGGGGLVLMGQIDGGDSFTWVGSWSDGGYAWTQPNASLSAEYLPQAMAVDPASGAWVEVVVDQVDGGDPTVGLPVELWTWDGSSGPWTMAGTVPSVLWTEGMGFGLAPLPFTAGGPSLDLIQSGGGNVTDLNLACTLAPLSCNLIHVAATYTLPPLYPVQMAFDSTGDGVLSGIAAVTPAPTTMSTWVWGGNDWNVGQATGPSLRSSSGMAFDPAANAFWLLGGLDATASTPLSDVWTYTSGGGWVLSDADAGVANLDGDLLAFIPDAGMIATGSGGPALRLVGTDAGSIAVEPLTDGGPTGTWAFDPVRNRVVLADVYGTVLYEATPPDLVFHQAYSGAVQGEAEVVYDGPSRSLLIIGGSPTNGAPILGQAQRWDGATLTDLPLTDPDGDGNPDTSDSLVFPTVAYDPSSERTLLVAPNTPQNVTDTWQLDLGDDRPALVCQFRFAAAQAPAGVAFTELQVEGSAAASAPDGGFAATDLALWSGETWRVVQTCGAGCPSLSYDLQDPAAITALLDDLETLGVSVAPSVTNGPGLAKVEVGSLQATLSYRLP